MTESFLRMAGLLFDRWPGLYTLLIEMRSWQFVEHASRQRIQAAAAR